MALSQVYLEWEKQTKRSGLEQGLEQGKVEGIEEERRGAIENLILLRFGEIDAELQGIIPNLMSLPTNEYTRLLIQLSRVELVQHCQYQN
jgi:hypothetical protein